MSLVDVGRKAPALTLKDQNEEKHALKDYLGKPVVLYFYPKDDTSGCTAQACQFRDDQTKFKRSKAVVLGVSPDSEASHAKFVTKHDLNFTLLSDPKDADGNPKICMKYGVWQEKSMYGRKYMGVARTTYLIDGKGKIARRWDKVKVPGHAEEVLQAVKDLNAS
ncbi:MAG: thioredoxin-dependent thiol peroxidase [Planctomycetaceae bacterium]|jgi:peroxiredoxin Q/BCP|nr:thioredoxin-dependent thiol peroxidase [Planctomycetaceae bacterium]